MSTITYAQTATSTETSDSLNIYYQALKLYVETRWPNNTDPAVLLVEQNYLFTDPLPTAIHNYKFEYLDGYDVNQKLKHKNPFTLLRIIPLRMEKGLFYITIIPFTVKKEKKKVRYANSGGDDVIFEYDCETKTFRFKELVHGNI